MNPFLIFLISSYSSSFTLHPYNFYALYTHNINVLYGDLSKCNQDCHPEVGWWLL
ncbi:hypothetical protein RDI58_014364 [Solanum bulbocastanum]|uniref:Uncharacterized protein n=1 Tax=Solanum bulbocastanum TaxID=147425 RepID=A0AAN8TFS4_SOLBU